MGLFGNMLNRMERTIERDLERPCAPGGSWRETARDIQVTGAPGFHTVSAELKDSMGFWRRASTQFRQGDRFENDNGQFRLARGPAGNGQGRPDPPAGSWQQSARPGSIRVNKAPNGDGWVLHAELKTANGFWNEARTHFHPRSPHEHFENDNGQFRKVGHNGRF